MDKLKSVSSTKKISEIIILICYDLTWTRERKLYIESNFLPRLNKNQASNTNGFFHHNGSRGHWRSWEIIIDSPACMGHEKKSKQTTIKKQNIKQQQKKNWLDEAEYQERKPPTESNKRQYYEKQNLPKPVQTTEVAFQKPKKLTNKNQSIKTENRQISSRTKQKTFGLQWPNLKKRIDKKWIERCTLTP